MRTDDQYGDGGKNVDAGAGPEADRVPESGGDTDTTEIRSGIEQTRAEMSETIDAIQAKLNPQTLVEQAKDTVREATVGRVEELVNDTAGQLVGQAQDRLDNLTGQAQDMVGDLVDTIMENPLPAALAGVGLGWLVLRHERGSSADQFDYDPQMWEGSGYSGGQMANQYERRYGAPYEEDYYYEGRYSSNEDQGPVSSIVDTVRQNPLPAALAGIGLWLLMRRGGTPGRQTRFQRSYRPDRPGEYRPYTQPYMTEPGRPSPGQMVNQAQQKVSDTVDQAKGAVGNAAYQARDSVANLTDQAKDTAGNVASQAGDTVSNLASQASDTVGNLASQAQYQGQRAQTEFQRLMYESPLAVGAMAAVIGAAVGLAVPGTRQEQELMGPARDKLMDKAQTVAQNTLDKVERVAGEVKNTAQQEVNRAAGEIKNTAQQEARNQGLTQGASQDQEA